MKTRYQDQYQNIFNDRPNQGQYSLHADQVQIKTPLVNKMRKSYAAFTHTHTADISLFLLSLLQFSERKEAFCPDNILNLDSMSLCSCCV